jgi:hypothetical protein
MSDYRILHDLSLHLQTLLFEGLSASAAPVPTKDSISFFSPAEIVDLVDAAEQPNLRISLYLFLVQPNGQLNNERFIRVGNVQYAPPFYVDVSYLITPVAPQPADNLLLLGGIINVLSANGILRAPFLHETLRPSQGEARLRMLQYDLENMSKLWSAFTKPYRMSLCYEVAAVPVESLRLPQYGPPVEEALLDIQKMSGA